MSNEVTSGELPVVSDELAQEEEAEAEADAVRAAEEERDRSEVLPLSGLAGPPPFEWEEPGLPRPEDG